MTHLWNSLCCHCDSYFKEEKSDRARKLQKTIKATYGIFIWVPTFYKNPHLSVFLWRIAAWSCTLEELTMRFGNPCLTYSKSSDIRLGTHMWHKKTDVTIFEVCDNVSWFWIYLHQLSLLDQSFSSEQWTLQWVTPLPCIRFYTSPEKTGRKHRHTKSYHVNTFNSDFLKDAVSH